MTPCSFLPCVISVGENKSSLDVTMFLLVYTEKIDCSNSDSNKEAIREQQQSGSNGGATMEST